MWRGEEAFKCVKQMPVTDIFLQFFWHYRNNSGKRYDYGFIYISLDT